MLTSSAPQRNTTGIRAPILSLSGGGGLKSFNRDERAMVHRFATSTSRAPLGGFNDLQGVQGTQRFPIRRAYYYPHRLRLIFVCCVHL